MKCINIDVLYSKADVIIDDVECIFDSAQHFIDETGFDFPTAMKVFFEPERNMFIVEREMGRCESGSDLPESVWLTANISQIKEAAQRVNASRVPPYDWRATRLDKLALTDWLTVRHTEQLQTNTPTSISAEQYSELLAYRQSLRDLTDDNHSFPTPPSFVQSI
jgi:hypothetical protein